MMTMTFADVSLRNLLKDKFPVSRFFYFENEAYLVDAMTYIMHFNPDSEEIEKIFNDILFQKSEGLFYELVGYLVNAYNGGDTIVLFNKMDDYVISMIESIIHSYQFYFGVKTNLVLVEEDIENITSINESELFDVANLVRYIEVWLAIHNKVQNGYVPSKIIRPQRSAFVWNNRL